MAAPPFAGTDPTCAAGAADLSRGELFAGLSVLGFANGIVPHISEAIAQQGALLALVGTFDISVLVWIAFGICPALMLRAPREPPNRRDIVAAIVAAGAFLLPVHWLSWTALTGLAVYLISSRLAARPRPPVTPLHRGVWVLLAITGAMFWGRVLMLVAGDFVLRADAVLVSWLAWTPRLGNIVQSASGPGYVWIAPGCSSLTNVSLALLCWVLFAQCRGLRWSPANAGWCALACLAVIGINVTRIGLIVLHAEDYDLVHGPIGATIASWLTVAAAVAICDYGGRRGRLARA